MSQAKYEIDGKEYTLSALDHGDWQKLIKYLQYRDYYNLKKDAENIPELEDAVKDCLFECAKKKVNLDDLQSSINAGGFDIITEVVFMSLNKYHKDIDKNEISHIAKVEDYNEIMTLIMDISGVGDVQEKEGEAKKKADVL